MGLQTGGHQTLAAGIGTFGYELIMRDKNHPSTIIWSVANEPMTGSAPDVPMPEAVAAGTSFFRQLYDETRKLDRTRPVTLVGLQGGPAEWLGLFNIVGINRYYGWYSMPGQLDQARQELERELDALHKSLGKPIIMTEFGADTLPGAHNIPPECGRRSIRSSS